MDGGTLPYPTLPICGIGPLYIWCTHFFLLSHCLGFFLTSSFSFSVSLQAFHVQPLAIQNTYHFPNIYSSSMSYYLHSFFFYVSCLILLYIFCKLNNMINLVMYVSSYTQIHIYASTWLVGLSLWTFNISKFIKKIKSRSFIQIFNIYIYIWWSVGSPLWACVFGRTEITDLDAWLISKSAYIYIVVWN